MIARTALRDDIAATGRCRSRSLHASRRAGRRTIARLTRALRPGGTLEVTRGAAIDLTSMTEDDYNLDTGTGHVVAG